MSDAPTQDGGEYDDLIDAEHTPTSEGESWGEVARRLGRDRENRTLRLPRTVPIAAEVGLDAAADALQEDDVDLAALFLRRTADALEDGGRDE